MPINITDELHAATTKGKIASAKEVVLTGDTENLQQIGEKTHQLEDSIKNIAATGGASTAAAVTFDNAASGMTAVNAQGAIEELNTKNNAQDTEIAKKANSTDVNSKMNEESTRVDTEIAKKVDKTSIVQEFGDSEDKIISQKTVKLSVDKIHEKIDNLGVKIGKLEIPIYADGKYIDLSGGIGSYIDINNPAIGKLHWRYMVYKCNPGDTIIINGRGGVNAKLYAFIDSAQKIIELSNVGDMLAIDLVVKAPENADSIIINDTYKRKMSYYLSKDSLEILKADKDIVDSLSSNVDKVSSIVPFVESRTVLSAYVASNIKKSLNIGEFGYSSNVRKIYYKFGKGDEDFKIIEPSINTTYVYNNVLFKWSGTQMSATNIDKIDGFIVLKKIASSGLVSSLNIGEYGYNNASNYVYYKYCDDSYGYFSFPAKETITYMYDCMLYKYTTGVGIEKIIDLNEAHNQIHKEYLNTNGGDVSYKTLCGHNYIIKNISGKEINIYVKKNKDSENTIIKLGVANEDLLVYKANNDGEFIRLTSGGGQIRIWIVETSSIEGRVTFLEQNPYIDFIPDTELLDVSSIISQFDFSSGGKKKIMEQVYDKFDKLVEANTDCMTKVDAATEAGLSYPTYANLNEEDGKEIHNIELSDGETYTFKYKVTPSYKTFMYKIIDQSPLKLYNRFPKKKILIIGGLHGNEIAACVNLYTFTKNIVECSSINYDKLRSVFDFYIIPCLNGYGIYHQTRANANCVNINRNYPTSHWHLSGNDSSVSSSGNNDYSGNTGGSEFETQLVMKLVDIIKPDMVIDHHNYSKDIKQFFTTLTKNEYLPFGYKALQLCSFAFRKGLSKYFGNRHKLFIDDKYISAPISLPANKMTTAYWADEHGIKVPMTIEVSECINYLNGTTSTSENDVLGNDTFSIAEYTLRTQIILYASPLLKIFSI